MNDVLEGRLAAHRAYMILNAAGHEMANPYGGNAIGLKAAMKNAARFENRIDDFVFGFEAESEQIRKDLYSFTESLSWRQ